MAAHGNRLEVDLDELLHAARVFNSIAEDYREAKRLTSTAGVPTSSGRWISLHPAWQTLQNMAVGFLDQNHKNIHETSEGIKKTRSAYLKAEQDSVEEIRRVHRNF